MEYYAVHSDSEEKINQIIELAQTLGVEYRFIDQDDFEWIMESRAARKPGKDD